MSTWMVQMSQQKLLTTVPFFSLPKGRRWLQVQASLGFVPKGCQNCPHNKSPHLAHLTYEHWIDHHFPYRYGCIECTNEFYFFNSMFLLELPGLLWPLLKRISDVNYEFLKMEIYIKLDSDLRIIKTNFVYIFEVENQPLRFFFSSM
jgi:hypothetical protein